MPTIYETLKDKEARYVLGEFGRRTLLVIGVNPSTATDMHYDQTIRRVKGYALRQGFDGWVMLNLYPQRTTRPKGLHGEKEFNKSYHRNNLNQIEKVINKYRAKKIWAAWGNLISVRSYLNNCLKDIYSLTRSKQLKWCRLVRRTRRGHPRHPARMSYKEKLEDFDIESYLSSWMSDAKGAGLLGPS